MISSSSLVSGSVNNLYESLKKDLAIKPQGLATSLGSKKFYYFLYIIELYIYKIINILLLKTQFSSSVPS